MCTLGNEKTRQFRGHHRRKGGEGEAAIANGAVRCSMQPPARPTSTKRTLNEVDMNGHDATQVSSALTILIPTTVDNVIDPMPRSCSNSHRRYHDIKGQSTSGQ